MIPQPLGVRVLVTALDEERHGIWVPPGAIRVRRGIVSAAGEDVRYLSVADEVLFASEAQTVYEFTHDGESYFVMPEAAVMVVLDRHPSAVR